MNRRLIGLAAAALAVVVGLVVISADDDGDSGDEPAAAVAEDETSGGDEADPATGSSRPSTTGAGADDLEPGTIDEPAPTIEAETAEPVAIDETADFGDGVRVRLREIESTEAEARLPGERSGPAVAVTVEVTNGSAEAVSLDRTQVDLTDAQGSSATPITDPEREPLRGELAPGATATGSYVFSLDPSDRSDVTIRIKYSAETPTILFRGPVPGG